GGPGPAPLLAGRAAAAVERGARPDVARRPAAAAAARLRAPRGLAQEALPGAAGHHRPVADLGALRAGLRRPRAARLPLPRALVGLPGPEHPRQDGPGGAGPPRRVLVPHALRRAMTSRVTATAATSARITRFT